VHIDDHHTVEDVAICLGEAMDKALGDKAGIARYGSARVPMDEALAEVSIDISGRSAVVWAVKFTGGKIGSFDTQLIEEFLRRLAAVARINLHVAVPYGSNDHHIAEAIFKALAQALRQAKLEYLKTESGRTLSPKYWAGLILIGDTSAVPLSTGKSSLLWWLAGMLVLLAAGAYLISRKRF
jgi:imidazoleglycerol phosphate dehydratase HisB